MSFNQLHGLTQLPVALGQTTSAASLSVVLASDASLPVTVMSPANDPLYVRLSNGAIAIDTLPVSNAGITSIDGKLTVGSGAATSALLTTLSARQEAETTPLSSRLSDGAAFYVGAKTGQLPTALGSTTSAASLSVTLASDQGSLAVTQSGTWTIVGVSGSVSLPTGASTEATLAAASAKLPATLGQKLMASSLAVVLASDQTAIPASQSGTWNVTNVSGTVSLPTGAATETTLAAASAKLPATLGQKVMTASLAVVLASDQTAMPTDPAAKTMRNLITYDYTGGTVTTAAYTQILASTSGAIKRLHVFDSSGSAIILAVGGGGSEVDTVYIAPGGYDCPIDVAIAGSVRLSIKALDASASTGRLIITALS